MARLIWSQRAQDDFERVIAFLESRSISAATKAGEQILASAAQLETFPASGRPVTGLPPEYRDLIIPFGASAYILRYRLHDADAVVLAIRHAREAGFDLEP